MTSTEGSHEKNGEAVILEDTTTIMFQLDWDDEPRETLRMRCLEYEEENGGQWVLYILPNLEETDSGWWRFYEIDPARVGREYSINTKMSLKLIRGLLESAASRIGLTLEETEPYEKLSIRKLLERVATRVGGTEERYRPETGKKMFPPKEVIRIDVFRKADGALIHLKEDPMPFDETNRTLWLESFMMIRARNRQQP